MSCYHHLSIEEREKLLEYKAEKCSMREIGRRMGRSAATISRELKRNTRKKHGYLPIRAQRKYEARRKKCVRKPILEKQPELRDIIHFFLVYMYWSPEQIVKRLEKEGYAQTVSVPTIYRAISSGVLRRSMAYYLRIKGKTIGKAPKKHKKFIRRYVEERPEEANQRTELGHFESDSVMGCCEKTCLFTHVDRKSRYLLAGVSDNKEAKNLNAISIQLFSRLPQGTLRSITCDQGTEFSLATALEDALDVPIFFAHPHSPWQKPTIENTNGLLRQFFPRGQKLQGLSQDLLDRVVALLNLRPRKCLDWLSPFEVFFDSSLHFT